MKNQNITLKHPFGTLRVEILPTGKKRIKVVESKVDFVSSMSCDTLYSIDLISLILKVIGPAYACDEIQREEDPYYVEKRLRRAILAFVHENRFENTRLLDFGCGAGSSTMILARTFPKTEIVGIDISENLLQIAKFRREFYSFSANRMKFLLSSNPNDLPKEIGKFDFIVLNEVYEHLLPKERQTLLKQLWNHLNPTGILFINGTPYRYYPLEIHTTGLPLINYLPDRMAYAIALRYSKRVKRDSSWKMLLRRGIRGATEREIMGILRKLHGNPIHLEPNRLGISNRIDLWFLPTVTGTRSTGSFVSFSLAYSLFNSQLLQSFLKFVLKTTGIPFTSYVTMSIQKS